MLELLSSHACHGGEQRILIVLAARLLDPAVLDEGERSAGDEDISDLLPADRRVNPVKRGRGERCPEPLAGQRRVLEAGVHELHAVQVLPGQG